MRICFPCRWNVGRTAVGNIEYTGTNIFCDEHRVYPVFNIKELGYQMLKNIFLFYKWSYFF